MSSSIEGYSYDIFISYRQKDNKHDGWVTEFVNNLKGELESTFKEEISVYFDINPHDGLLETYDVDASLQDKLKCLILIPIISRTYCDPKSFAWEHEFKAFIKQASNDQFGLKVKLPNGNVANRIIPVQIHDLYPEDKVHVEKEIGGFLRAVEFIYKEPGVNKPLTVLDNEKVYRIQINKVANAIEEVIHTLQMLQITPGEKTIPSAQPIADESEEKKHRQETKGILIHKKNKKRLIAALSIVLFVVTVFEVYKIIQNSNKNNDIAKLEKSIAVLPFVNDSPNQENTFFINGIMDEILNNLQKIKNLRVLSRTSTEQYRGTNKPPIPKIAKDLDVNYIVEGSGQKYGNTFRLRVQLIDALNDKHIWAESYEQEIKEVKDIFRIQSQVAQSIAKELSASISPEEKNRIEKVPTADLTSYDLCRRGFDKLFEKVVNNKELEKSAEDLFKRALKNDPSYALGYVGLAHVYWRRNNYIENAAKNYLDSMLALADIALSYDNQLAEAYFVRGGYYDIKGNAEKAMAEYDKAIKINPNNWLAYLGKGGLTGLDFRSKIENLLKASTLNRGAGLYNIYYTIADKFAYAGFPDQVNSYLLMAYKLDGDSIKYLFNLADKEYEQGNYQKSIELMEKVYAKDSLFNGVNRGLALDYMYTRKYEKSLKYLKKWVTGDLIRLWPDELTFIGYIYWMNSNKKEAKYYFDKAIEDNIANLKIMSPDMFNYTTTNPNVNLTSLYSFLGDREKAYKNLRIVSKIQVCPLWFLRRIQDDPLYDNIRNDTEFKNIVNDLESKYRAQHEEVRKWLEEKRML